MDASKLGETPVSKSALGGIRPTEDKGDRGELPSVPRSESDRSDRGGEEGRGRPGTAYERPAAEGVAGERPTGEPIVERPAIPDEAAAGGRPPGVVSDVIPEGTAAVAGVEEKPADGRRKPGKPEGIPERAEKPDVRGVPGVDDVVNELLNLSKKELMAEKLDPSELVSFKELLMANSIQVDAIAQLLIEKGFFTKEEFFAKLKQVQSEYKSNTDD